MSTSDIDTLLRKWSSAKQEISELENKIEKYKRVINRIMDRDSIDIISSSDFKITRKIISRNTISKQDVPKDIWKKYSHSCSYPAYYLVVKES